MLFYPLKVPANVVCSFHKHIFTLGTQWLSGRVLDSTLRGYGFKPHQRLCLVSLSKTLYPLLSTGSRLKKKC